MRLWLIPVFAFSAFAQFVHFSVSDSGALLFTTTLQHESQPVLNSRSVFRLEEGRISLVGAQPKANVFPVPPIPPGFGGPPTIEQTLLSGDGKIFAYGIYSVPPILRAERPLTTFTFPESTFPPITTGKAQISRNGKYVLGRWTNQLGLSEYLRYERGAAAPSKLLTTFYTDDSNQPIADTGEFLFFERPPVNPTPGQRPPPDLFLAAADAAMTKTKIAERADFASISPDGRKISFVQTNGDQRYLYLLNRNTGEQQSLGPVNQNVPGRGLFFSAMFANDGSLLWQSRSESDGTHQLKYIAASGMAVQLPAFEFGVRTALVAGNGKNVFAMTGNARIVRIDLETNEVFELVPETTIPFPESEFAVVPGSTLRLYGPASNKAVAFLDNDTIPIVNRDMSNQGLQIPWNAPASSQPRNVFVRIPGNPFFHHARTQITATPKLKFELMSDGAGHDVPPAAHQDFRGLVTAADPAAPGETIHVFARNLGPVDRPVATGEISPSDPPARITTPLVCYLRELDQTTQRHKERIEGLTIPFAGLTAGSVGGYHIDITIPAVWPAGTHELLCQLNGEGSPITIAIGR